MFNVKKVSFLRGRVVTGLVAIFFLASSTSLASASHSWGKYHWARNANPFTLQLVDNLHSNWKPFLETTTADWSQSTILDTTITPGAGSGKCGAILGKVNICNDRYGNNGWLGIASISISGSHITQGTVKVNDTYFNTTKYNTSAWKNMVMCQEVGHTFGLGHNDGINGNYNNGTCMDYTNAPAGGVVGGFDYGPSNERRNIHDDQQLVTIYGGHTDLSSTIASTTTSAGKSPIANSDDPSSWGKPTGLKDSRGRSSHFELDLGNGQKVITFVIWADN